MPIANCYGCLLHVVPCPWSRPRTCNVWCRGFFIRQIDWISFLDGRDQTPSQTKDRLLCYQQSMDTGQCSQSLFIFHHNYRGTEYCSSEYTRSPLATRSKMQIQSKASLSVVDSDPMTNLIRIEAEVFIRAIRLVPCTKCTLHGPGRQSVG